MKIEIWSDVMCPFCYIGKRRFEDALAQFAHKDEVTVEWKSFQLNPDLVTDTTITSAQYLADRKGFPLEHAQELQDHVTEMAAEVGLTYNLENSVVANSFDAHRFAHLAKQKGLGDEAEEALFKAYFTDSQNISDANILADLGTLIGLDAQEVHHTLSGNKYVAEVKKDIAEAAQLGINAVPFFVMDRKYGVSGAQAAPVFLQTLEKAFADWQVTNKPLDVVKGESCEVGGDC
jgi:predicted DsbA family dithiol-disulfide isomerase